MYDLFFEKIGEKVILSKEQQDLIRTFLMPKKLRRRQYLLQEGDVAKNFAFVTKGALRAYSIDEKGEEHIIQFALEGATITDLNSFLSSGPASYYIDALEDSELIIVTKAAHDEILRLVPEYEVYTRMIITSAYISMQERINSIISKPLEERYQNFIKLFPDVAQRVPQHMIASYMGLKPETISRIRGKMKQK